MWCMCTCFAIFHSIFLRRNSSFGLMIYLEINVFTSPSLTTKCVFWILEFELVYDEILMMHQGEWMCEMSVIVIEQILLHSLGNITELLWIWASGFGLSYNVKLDECSWNLFLMAGIASYILLKNDLRRLRLIIITNIHDPYNWFLFVHQTLFSIWCSIFSCAIKVVKLEKRGWTCDLSDYSRLLYHLVIHPRVTKDNISHPRDHKVSSNKRGHN